MQKLQKVQAKEKASAYLRDHPNAGKSTVRDDGYYEILKEGGLTNDSYQKMVKQDQKVAYEQNQIEKR